MALTNAADGTLSASYEYDPFGNLLEMSGAFAAPNPYRFSGNRQDELTGFYDYGFRSYDPTTAPSGPPGPNSARSEMPR